MMDDLREELARLRGEVQRLAARVCDLERRARPWWTGWRSRLAWLLGARIGELVHHAPRPMRLPRRYATEPVPARGPLISIVTPSYQQAGFLPATLESVLGQGYPRLELIVQ